MIIKSKKSIPMALIGICVCQTVKIIPHLKRYNNEI